VIPTKPSLGSTRARHVNVHAMELTVAASDTIGVRMLVVTALHPSAAAFYERFGLSRSPTNPLDLMITVADIEAAMWAA